VLGYETMSFLGKLRAEITQKRPVESASAFIQSLNFIFSDDSCGLIHPPDDFNRVRIQFAGLKCTLM
jgi:hypothetical protein